jgi:hypothetical protein
MKGELLANAIVREPKARAQQLGFGSGALRKCLLNSRKSVKSAVGSCFLQLNDPMT